jgi:hypothetical protein
MKNRKFLLLPAFILLFSSRVMAMDKTMNDLLSMLISMMSREAIIDYMIDVVTDQGAFDFVFHGMVNTDGDVREKEARRFENIEKGIAGEEDKHLSDFNKFVEEGDRDGAMEHVDKNMDFEKKKECVIFLVHKINRETDDSKEDSLYSMLFGIITKIGNQSTDYFNELSRSFTKDSN